MSETKDLNFIKKSHIIRSYIGFNKNLFQTYYEKSHFNIKNKKRSTVKMNF